MVLNKRKRQLSSHDEPEIGNVNELYDDIIAVRKKTSIDEPSSQQNTEQELGSEYQTKEQSHSDVCDGPLVLIYLVAKEGKQFVGYELLQALLSVGMRFGDMDIFHRHQESSGKGPVLFSLASASESGTFDIHKMGAFTGRGLCLYMHLSGSPTIDNDRFHLMIKTAYELSEDLDADLLDSERCPLSQQSLVAYQSLIQGEELQSA
jgi:cell division protein ZipA